MQKLDEIYNAYSDEAKLLLQKIEKIEKLPDRGSNPLQLNYINIISQIKESAGNLKEAIVDLDIKMNIVVFGKFKSGKSSFINKLFGRNLAAVDDAEMNYYLNYITYGENEKSTIIYKDDACEVLSYSELNKKLLDGRYNEDFAESIKLVECLYPYKELENVNLWDTPGFGTTNLGNKLKAAGIMSDADVVLWIMDATDLGSTVDKEYIDQLVSRNVPVICIVNKVDLLGAYEDCQKQIIEMLDSLYPGVFKEVFFCSSLPDCDISFEEELDKVKAYLTSNIFRKKKELVLASAINKGINILQNIFDTLESYHLHLKERKIRYDNYLSSIEITVKREIPELENYIFNYLDNYFLVDEFKQLLIELETGNISNQEIAQDICSRYINDKSLQKYIDQIESIVRNKFEDIWHKTIIDDYENIFFEDRQFFVSNFHLVDEAKPNVNEMLKNDSAEINQALTVSTMAIVASLLASSHPLMALITGIAYVYVWLFGKKEPDAAAQTYKKINETELAEFRAQIKKEYLNSNLFPRISEAIKSLYKLAIEKAQKDFFNSRDSYTMENAISAVAKFIPESARYRELLNDELKIIDAPIFADSTIMKEDFIIAASNPNAGIENLQRLLARATGYLYVVDPYFNAKSLEWLKYLKNELSVKVLLHNLDEDIENHSLFIEKLNQLREKRTGSILVRLLKYRFQKGSPLHDRFIFTSRFGLQLGNSLDAVGKKDISVTFIKDLASFKEQFFDYYWTASSVKYEDREKQIIKFDL